MSGQHRYFRSSIGKKTIMAITGLIWSGFIFTHMAANMLILFSPEAYNHYGHAITSNLPLLYATEAILLLSLVLHVFMAFKLTKENREARPVGYAYSPSGDKSANLAQKTMIYTGSVILAFLIYHLITFKFGAYYVVEYDGVEIRDLHRLILEVFQSPAYVLGYVVSLLLLGLHVSHGFQAAFQSLGFRHPRYIGLLKTVGWIYTIVVIGGFLSQPLYVFFIAG